MPLDTKTITAYGSSAEFDYAGGVGAVTVSGQVHSKARLMMSLDDTNFEEVTLFTKAGAKQIGNIPACKMRWDVQNDGSTQTPNFVANVENA